MPETGYTIRQAVPADAAAITRIYMESARHHKALNPQRRRLPDRDKIEDRYRKERQHPPGAKTAVTLVAEEDETLVGFIDARLETSSDAMHDPAPFCYVADIAVRATHHKRGIGRLLMDAAEAWAREQDVGKIVLEYEASNDAADFYDRLGYEADAVVAVKTLDG